MTRKKISLMHHFFRFSVSTIFGFCLLTFSTEIFASSMEFKTIFDQANYHFVKEDFEKAVELYKSCSDLATDDEDNDLVLFLIGRSLEQLDRNAEADSAYSLVQKKFPQSQWVDNSLLCRTRLAKKHHTRSSYEQAIKYCEEIISDFDQGDCKLEALFELGTLYFILEEWKNAERSFNQVLENNPPDKLAVEVLLTLADFYRERANSFYNLATALHIYQTIIEKYPKSAPYPSTYLAMGNTYRDSGNQDKAIQCYQKIVSAYPDSSQAVLAQSMLALSYEETNQVPQSLEAYDALKKYVTSPLMKEPISQRAQKVQRLHRDALRVEADTIEYNAALGKAEYEGDVSIYWYDSIISCQRAIAWMEKKYIIAEKEVQCIDRQDLKLTAHILHLFPKLKQAILYGDATIIRLDPKTKEEMVVIQGKKITFNFETSQYILED